MANNTGRCQHFAVGTHVAMFGRGRGEVVARDGHGGMTVRWLNGHTTHERPFALSHEGALV